MKSKLFMFLRHPWVLGFFALLFPVSASWLADGINGQCLWPTLFSACSSCTHWLRVLISLVMVLGSMAAIWFGSRHLLAVRHLRPARKVTPHKVLIAAMSPLRHKLIDLPNHGLAVAGARDGESLKLTGDLGTDIDEISKQQAAGFWGVNTHWNGQQFLRAIREHAGKLEYAMLLGSARDKSKGQGEDKNASWPHLGSYTRLLAFYLPAVQVEHWRQGIEFEDIHAMSDAIRACVKVMGERGYHESDLMIDITGGQKTASIAAALTTLDYAEMEFQYVQTGSGEVISFNVVAAARSSYSGI